MASAKNEVWKWMNESNFNLTKIRSLKYLPLPKRKPNVAQTLRMHSTGWSPKGCTQLKSSIQSVCVCNCTTRFANGCRQTSLLFKSKYQFPKKVSFQLSNNNFDAIKCMRMYHCEQLSFQCKFYSFLDNKGKNREYFCRWMRCIWKECKVRLAIALKLNQCTKIWKF